MSQWERIFFLGSFVRVWVWKDVPLPDWGCFLIIPAPPQREKSKKEANKDEEVENGDNPGGEGAASGAEEGAEAATSSEPAPQTSLGMLDSDDEEEEPIQYQALPNKPVKSLLFDGNNLVVSLALVEGVFAYGVAPSSWMDPSQEKFPTQPTLPYELEEPIQ